MPNCTFYKNLANFYGGGLYIESYSNYSNSDYCFFFNNRAGTNGGALVISINSIY
jgi:hypothetical protein